MNQPTNQFLFEQIARVSRLVRRKFQTIGKQMGELTLVQFQVLLYLKHMQQGTMQDLADELQITAASATALIDRLVLAGWVKRTADSTDRRITTVALTHNAQQHFQSIVRQKMEQVDDLLNSLTMTDRRALARILDRIETRLQSRKSTN